MPHTNYIYEYHAALQCGKEAAGRYVHTVYEIIVEGLQRGDYLYDAKKAGKAVRFIENFCRHSEGRADLFKLELWQKAIVAAIFGIVDEDGLRVWREIFVVVGRKNGKTLLASAIIACIVYLDGEYGAKVFCLAPKLDQAEKVYDGFYQMVKKEPLLADRSKKRRSDIYVEESNSMVKPLAFNAKKADGFNPSLVVNDEVHSWAGNRGLMMYEVMKSALGARRQPFIFTISTAGYENDGIYDELYKRSTAFLNRDSRERRLLPIIYKVDDERKWKCLDEIRKANPNMDVSVKASYFEDEIAIAETSLSKLREFKMKYCNVKQSQAAAWLDNRLLENSMTSVTFEDFRRCYAVGGFDLSQTTDLTAASIVIEREGKLYTFCQFFMPENKIEDAIREDSVPYDLFIKQGVVRISGENYVDYKDIYDWFVMIREKYDIYVLKIGYDRYAANYLVQDLKTYGYHLDDVWQGDNLAPVIREFEGAIKDGDFYIANNNLLKAHFLNVALKHNLEKRTFRPVKIEARKRIDGFVAAINALTVRQKYAGEVGEMLKNKGR